MKRPGQPAELARVLMLADPLQVRFRRNDCSDWWKADPVNAGTSSRLSVRRSRISQVSKRLRKAAFFEQLGPGSSRCC